MPELEIGLADGSELNFGQSSCSLLQRKRHMRKLLLN